MAPNNGIDVGVYFLRKEERHKFERPYAFKFDPTDGFPGSNVVNDWIKVHVYDMRGREQEFDMETHGFCIQRIDDPLSYEDYFKPERLETYFKHMEAILKDKLQASKVKVFRHCVSPQVPSLWLVRNFVPQCSAIVDIETIGREQTDPEA